MCGEAKATTLPRPQTVCSTSEPGAILFITSPAQPAGRTRRPRDAEETQLGLKVAAHVLTAVVVTDCEAGRRNCDHSLEIVPVYST